jgi:hypothetical protein
MRVEEIPMLPLTLGNEQTIRPYYERVRDYCQTHGVQQMVRTIARLRANDPALHALIDEAGRPSDVWIAKQVTTMLANDKMAREFNELAKDVPELTREAAEAIARKDHEKAMTDYFGMNPGAAQKLYFDFAAFPETLAALKLGRDVIIGCADYDAVDAAHGSENAQALADAESDFWKAAQASEVAAWINNFRAVWQ